MRFYNHHLIITDLELAIFSGLSSECLQSSVTLLVIRFTSSLSHNSIYTLRGTCFNALAKVITISHMVPGSAYLMISIECDAPHDFTTS